MFRASYRYLYIVLLGTYSYLNIKFTSSDALFDFKISDPILLAFISFFVILIWEGNRFIQSFFKTLYDETPHYGPLLYHFLASLVLILLISIVGNLFAQSFLFVPEKSSLLKLMIGFNFRINLFLHCVNAIIHYRKKVNDYQIEAERFKKQSAEAQFDALRKQINPHFLFNSLNVLSTLVYQDPKRSAQFIDGLSKVYRYLLRNMENNLVKLSDELEFLDAYLFLIQNRFPDNLLIEQNINSDNKEMYVVPASLQLLIENAIKHNEISSLAPLKISLYEESGYIVVDNNVQLKEQMPDSSRVGLENIKNRYGFLSPEKPVIINSNGHFTVKIPLLKVEE